MRFLPFLLFIYLWSTGVTWGQILDDSTQNVYDASSVQWTTKEHLKYNLGEYFAIDTTIGELHKFGMVDEHDHLLQNLGNLGTALNPVFFTPPDIIGKTTGFTAYDLYFEEPARIKYYNTRTPFTDVRAVFAGSQRNIVDIGYTRNINPTWNVGFNFKRINAEKQLAREPESNRHALSTYYDFYTFFQTANKRYSLMANAARLNHEVNEIGGVDQEENAAFGQDNWYLYEDSNVLLDNAESREYRFNISLYHQYQLLSKNVELYHEMDVNTEKNSYIHAISTQDSAFYDQILIRPDSTIDEFKFREFRNEAGIKGKVENLFYSFFYKRRTTNFFRKYLDRDEANTENSGGFYLRWDFDSLHYLQTNGEYMLGGEHLLEASYKNRFFEARYKRIKSSPAYIHDAYFGNHFEWYNNFAPPQSDNLYGAFTFEFPRLRVTPFVRFSSVFNHIFFNQRSQPDQTAGFAQIMSPGVNFTLNPLKNIFWETEAIYTKVTGASQEAFRYPELFVNSTVYFQNVLFGNKLQLKMGLGAHYVSPYLAPAYSPVLQNFYLQDDFWVPKIDASNTYAAINAFVNFKIGNVRLFFRMEHLNQGDGDGYFVTPLFTGQKQTLNFGLHWHFFD